MSTQKSPISDRAAFALASSSLLGAGAAGCSDAARAPIHAPEAAGPRSAVRTETLELSNPLVLQRADAQIFHHSDGSPRLSRARLP